MPHFSASQQDSRWQPWKTMTIKFLPRIVQNCGKFRASKNSFRKQSSGLSPGRVESTWLVKQTLWDWWVGFVWHRRDQPVCFSRRTLSTSQTFSTMEFFSTKNLFERLTDQRGASHLARKSFGSRKSCNRKIFQIESSKAKAPIWKQLETGEPSWTGGKADQASGSKLLDLSKMKYFTLDFSLESRD